LGNEFFGVILNEKELSIGCEDGDRGFFIEGKG